MNSLTVDVILQSLTHEKLDELWEAVGKSKRMENILYIIMEYENNFGYQRFCIKYIASDQLIEDANLFFDQLVFDESSYYKHIKYILYHGSTVLKEKEYYPPNSEIYYGGDEDLSICNIEISYKDRKFFLPDSSYEGLYFLCVEDKFFGFFRHFKDAFICFTHLSLKKLGESDTILYRINSRCVEDEMFVI